MPDVNSDALQTDLLSTKQLTKIIVVLSATTLYLIQLRPFWLKDEIQSCGKYNLPKG